MEQKQQQAPRLRKKLVDGQDPNAMSNIVDVMDDSIYPLISAK